VGEQVLDSILQRTSQDTIIRPGAGHQLAGEVKGAFRVSFDDRFQRMGIVNTAVEWVVAVIIVYPDDKGSSHEADFRFKGCR